MATELTFTGQQAAEAQTALRKALGLAPEQFPLPAFVGMISDEIEQLRQTGKTDEEFAVLIDEAIGTTFRPLPSAHFMLPQKSGGIMATEL